MRLYVAAIHQYWHVFLVKLNAWLEDYDRKHPPLRRICDKNIICDCQRRNCPGRTYAVSTYIRRMRATQ